MEYTTTKTISIAKVELKKFLCKELNLTEEDVTLEFEEKVVGNGIADWTVIDGVKLVIREKLNK